MKIFGKYFAYHAKKSLGRFAVIAVLTLIYLLPELAREVNYNPPSNVDVYDLNIGIKYLLSSKLNSIEFITCILCTVLPILEFSGFHNRRNADTIFSMPISRQKLALTHFLNGVWQIVALVTCYTVMYANVYQSTTLGVYDMALFVPYYFATVLCCIFAYSFFVLVFNIASNIVDGVIFVIMYAYTGYILVSSMYRLFGCFSLKMSNDMSPYSLVENENNGFFDIISDGYTIRDAIKEGLIWDHMIVPMMIATVGTIVLVACLFLLFRYKKAEKIEGISNSPFGYALLIPIYGIFGGASSSCYRSITTQLDEVAFVIIAMVIGYMIYRRSFKLKFSDFIMIALACVMMFVAYPIRQIFVS